MGPGRLVKELLQYSGEWGMVAQIKVKAVRWNSKCNLGLCAHNVEKQKGKNVVSHFSIPNNKMFAFSFRDKLYPTFKNLGVSYLVYLSEFVEQDNGKYL